MIEAIFIFVMFILLPVLVFINLLLGIFGRNERTK